MGSEAWSTSVEILHNPHFSFKHKIVATNLKLPLSCVLIVGNQRLQILCYLHQYNYFLDHYVECQLVAANISSCKLPKLVGINNLELLLVPSHGNKQS